MHVLIVEDEPLIAKRLSRLVGEADSDVKSIEVVGTFESAQVAIQSRNDSIVMLDLNIHGRDGFDLLRQGLAEGWRTIVVSAHAERAIEAFEFGVIDFVPKPFNTARLSLAIQRAKTSEPTGRQRFLAAYYGSGTMLVPLDDIVAIHGADDYSEIETKSGQRLLHKKYLQSLDKELPNSFLRIHRSHIVQLKFAVEVHREDGATLLRLSNGESLPVGRRWVASLKKLLI